MKNNVNKPQDKRRAPGRVIVVSILVGSLLSGALGYLDIVGQSQGNVWLEELASIAGICVLGFTLSAIVAGIGWIGWRIWYLWITFAQSASPGVEQVTSQASKALPTPKQTREATRAQARITQTSTHLFVSYSNKDLDFGIRFVEDLRNVLREENAVWVDVVGQQHKEDARWRKVVEELTTREVFIVVLSPASLASEEINAQIDMAWRQKLSPLGKQIIPILHRPCQVRGDLDTLHIIRFLRPWNYLIRLRRPKTYEAAFKGLLQELGLPIDAEPMRLKQDYRVMSRRTVLTGLVAAGVVITGGYVSGRELFRPKPAPAKLAPSPTPTPLPTGGTLLYTYRGSALGVVWSPDGTRIASGNSDGTVQIWEAANGRRLYTYYGDGVSVTTLAWSPDSKQIASGNNNGRVQVWDAADGGHVYTYHGHDNGAYYNPVQTVAWSPDGKQRIASGGGDGTVQVWNATDGRRVYSYRGPSNEQYGYVNAVAWSPDGKRIVSANQSGETERTDRTVQVWDASNGGHVYTYRGHDDTVLAVAWSPDGKRITSGSRDKTVQIWNATDGSDVYIFSGHTADVSSVAWSPDSKRIASGAWDNTVQVLDATDGRGFTYRGHSNSVTSVTWSPDGTRIASASEDCTVQVWKAA